MGTSGTMTDDELIQIQALDIGESAGEIVPDRSRIKRFRSRGHVFEASRSSLLNFSFFMTHKVKTQLQEGRSTGGADSLRVFGQGQGKQFILDPDA